MDWSESARIAMIKKNLKMGDMCKLTGYSRQHLYLILHNKYKSLPKEATITISKILEIECPEW